MFSSFIQTIQAGKAPDLVDLRKRLDLALIKKTGVLNLPYHFWQSDPKINPSTAHMLWAATILEDQQGLAAAAEFAQKEAAEKSRFKKSESLSDGYGFTIILASFLDDLLVLTADTDLQSSIQKKCARAKMLLSL
jgi:hypothetical protein